VIPSSFEYSRATSVDDAIARLTQAGGEGKLIAGGHSLVPLMKLRLSEPKLLIDIARIPGLAGIRRKDHTIEIGAGTVHHDVSASEVLGRDCPMIAEAAGDIGDQQVRNRGTLGGSLAHADLAADYPAVILALDAAIHVRGPKGSRTVEAAKFFKGLFSVDLAADEIITSVEFKPVKTAAYAKLHQRASRFAIVGVAAALDVGNGSIRGARIAVTGAGTHATRLTEVEEALKGKPLSARTIRAAAQLAGSTIGEITSDIHASEAYRRAMIPVFTQRALERAMARGHA
jgi:aerobic carbon-monoxide dehydrogenase medium subunit